MKTYLKDFEIRWSDVDANRHLANSAYVNFMSHTRVAFFEDHNFSLSNLAKFKISPVVFYEHIYYFKEAFLGTPIRVSLEVKGLSEDGMFFEIEHNIYNHKGENLASCELMGAWINLKTRELSALPSEFLTEMDTFPISADFRTLTKEDTRKFGKKPVRLS
ncbi:acyl-CoA thioesterase [Gelidibacter salicanalis]|uniref:Acyl-CoA thioesterase n=1 Tax=Gelidibacter salicanalis TaxID=291193 RepID=A0A5C7AM21_9FLAO|nr:thioesterase family protein [Gelidibacter salicanalis]TXE08603.1 acyl-CoA thioesterase [Gelidibacter salicanalis]